jgi:predicted dehydrogenase
MDKQELFPSGISETLSRRSFLRTASGTVAATTLATGALAQSKTSGPTNATIPPQENYVDLSQIHGETEAAEHAPGPFLPTDARVGYAIVGLGRLSLNQILPAFGASKYAKPVALVSGDRAKAQKVAAQYGIAETHITDYANFERLAQMPGVDAIYIVLPDGMHKEFVLRSAKIGKHVLCEKPMANSAADCEAMIEACHRANVRLMIAYRQQYEPMNRYLKKMAADGKLGKLNSILSTNSQNTGDPNQWRLKKALAGGGALPDVGIYCLNAARFLSGEEPDEVHGTIHQPKDDPRFAEVEARCSFTAHFPSGLIATCVSAYDVHRSSMLRLEGSKAWAEMSPAFGYHGSKVRYSMLTGEGNDKKDTTFEPSIEDKDQFALEMDHFATCIRNNVQPHTPGEEGLQDQRIIEAIYKSAATGRTVKIAPPTKPTRGPALPEKI